MIASPPSALPCLRAGRLAATGLLLVSQLACSSTRTIIIESTPPAEIFSEGTICRVCRTTPCRVIISRETCGLFDSSSGVTVFRAVIDENRSQRQVFKTCALRSGETLRFGVGEGPLEPAPGVYRLYPSTRAPCRQSPLEETAGGQGR